MPACSAFTVFLHGARYAAKDGNRGRTETGGRKPGQPQLTLWAASSSQAFNRIGRIAENTKRGAGAYTVRRINKLKFFTQFN